MFKSIPSASRFITAGATLVLTICFGSCSTKSQLVERWSYNVTGLRGHLVLWPGLTGQSTMAKEDYLPRNANP